MVQRTPSIHGSGGAPDAGNFDADALVPAGGAPPFGPSAPATDESTHRAPTPFVWQRGRRLLLLDDESRGWVMAELRFDVERCRYVEVRRATYRWSREAVGAIISRALASGQEAAEDAAGRLNAWLAKYYGLVRYVDPAPASEAESSDFTR
jgi:hypothetical protein